MPKIGGRRKKARSHKEPQIQQRQLVPSTFVFKKGKCSEQCKQVAKDFRKCFYPHTALKLENSAKNSVKSYLKAAKHYSVSHLCTFYQSKEQNKSFLRIIQVGGGEMRFRVINYCRMKDVLKNGGVPFSLTLKQPLLVMNNFNTQVKQVQQISKGLQRMFPAVNLDKVKPDSLKRVISFTYTSKNKCIYFRHYKINFSEGGVSAKFKEIMSLSGTNKDAGKSDLSGFQSFSDFLNTSKSNGSHQETHEQQQTVKLQEIGPRMKLRFVNYYQQNGLVEQQAEEQENRDQQLAEQEQGKSEENAQEQQQQEQQMSQQDFEYE